MDVVWSLSIQLLSSNSTGRVNISLCLLELNDIKIVKIALSVDVFSTSVIDIFSLFVLLPHFRPHDAP